MASTAAGHDRSLARTRLPEGVSIAGRLRSLRHRGVAWHSSSVRFVFIILVIVATASAGACAPFGSEAEGVDAGSGVEGVSPANDGGVADGSGDAGAATSCPELVEEFESQTGAAWVPELHGWVQTIDPGPGAALTAATGTLLANARESKRAFIQRTTPACVRNVELWIKATKLGTATSVTVMRLSLNAASDAGFESNISLVIEKPSVVLRGNGNVELKGSLNENALQHVLIHVEANGKVELDVDADHRTTQATTGGNPMPFGTVQSLTIGVLGGGAMDPMGSMVEFDSVALR